MIRRTVHEYTVGLSAEYSVIVCAETMWEAEDFATSLVEEALKQNDIEEMETHVLDEHASYWVGDEYELRLKVNMVIPVEAEDFGDAFGEAVAYVENITMPDGIELECTAELDKVPTEDKDLLLWRSA